MKRRPLTILSALSLLLCTAIIVLWLRSHHTHHLLLFPALGRVWQISSLHGTLCFAAHRDTDVPAVSRFDRYPVSAGSESERRIAFDRLVESRRATFAAEDLADAVYHRIRAGDPAFLRPRLDAARVDFLTARQAEHEAFARWHGADAIAKARARLGFHRQPGNRNTSAALALPYWFLLVLTATPPAAAHLLLRRRARRRTRQGLCPHCNYDLRATPTQCPECGHTP